MSTELMIPDVIPAYLQVATTQDLAAEFAAGTSTRPPSVKLNGTRFVIVESDGAETTVNGLTIGAVILAARPLPYMKKSFYANAYKDGDAEAPDCYSEDGVKPDASIQAPQCDVCAGCPQNQFGTGRSQDGTPGKGKACADRKIIAIFPGNKAYKLEIPPASFKAYDAYVKDLAKRGLVPFAAKTIIGFDETVSYPRLTFKFGGVVEEALFPSVIEARESQEVKDIIEPFGGVAQIAAPAPVQQPAQTAAVVQEPAVEAATVVVATETVVIPPRVPGKPAHGNARRTKEEMAEDAALEAAQNPVAEVVQETGFGLDMGGAATEPEQAATQQATMAGPSGGDAVLKKTLGLDL